MAWSSGAASTFRQVGIATGIAGLGAVFVHQIRPAGGAPGSSPPRQVGRSLAHGGSSLARAVSTDGVRQAAACHPLQAGRNALLTSYQAGFTSTFDHLMGIATVVALVGAVGCLFLVRQKDFVPSHGEGEWKPPAGDAGDAEEAGDPGDGAARPTAAAPGDRGR